MSGKCLVQKKSWKVIQIWYFWKPLFKESFRVFEVFNARMKLYDSHGNLVWTNDWVFINTEHITGNHHFEHRIDFVFFFSSFIFYQKHHLWNFEQKSSAFHSYIWYLKNLKKKQLQNQFEAGQNVKWENLVFLNVWLFTHLKEWTLLNVKY